jgi:Asp-tRNA(Asn)/Glu-tRNA(Gln) amidotransferase B subunit
MPFEKALGLVMSKVRGRIEAKEVMKVVKKLLK